MPELVHIIDELHQVLYAHFLLSVLGRVLNFDKAEEQLEFWDTYRISFLFPRFLLGAPRLFRPTAFQGLRCYSILA
jgi:hypothetical protein